MTHIINPLIFIGMKKELTEVEKERVAELQKVWEYLYSNKAYQLCDIISFEIGYIKGMVKEDLV